MSNLGPKYRSQLLTITLVLFVCQLGCLIPRGQRYGNFTVSTPLRQNQILVLGFMGGREPWDNDKRSVRKLTLKLRSMNDPAICVETVENKKRSLAIELINNAFDRNLDDKLDAHERSAVRLILYGQSFGGAAVVKLARQLKRMDVPIALTVQVDSVGRNDSIIPSNVARAANLFQRDGWFIKGEPEIRAEDPKKTLIIGNFEFEYSNKKIDISGVSIMKKAFRVAHTKMEYDQQVWDRVESLILDTIQQLR
jgi:hypothetical protein